MSSYDPPEFVVSIYNPDFFVVDTGAGIPIGVASSLFLKKTVSDTATALETFTGGIATSTITGDPTGANTLFNDVTTGNIGIGTNSTLTSLNAINIATGNSTNVNNIINIGHANSTEINPKTSKVTVGDTIDTFTAGALTITVSGGAANALDLGSATSVTTVDIGNTDAGTVTLIQNPVLQMNYTTAPSLTNVNIGYSYRSNSAFFPSAIGNGGTAQAYSPSVGVGLTTGIGNYLVAGTYIMDVLGSITIVANPTTCSITMKVGLLTSASTTPSGTTTIQDITATTTNITTTSFIHYPRFRFIVTSPAYYYIMTAATSVTMTGTGALIQGAAQILSLVRIA